MIIYYVSVGTSCLFTHSINKQGLRVAHCALSWGWRDEGDTDRLRIQGTSCLIVLGPLADHKAVKTIICLKFAPSLSHAADAI